MIHECIPDKECEVVDLSKDASKDASTKVISTLETMFAWNSRKCASKN